jgi:hypothetical protein
MVGLWKGHRGVTKENEGARLNLRKVSFVLKRQIVEKVKLSPYRP